MTMFLNRETHWWYWAVTDVLLAGGLWSWPPRFWPVIGLTLVQVLHYLGRERSLSAFPVQVRMAYLGLLLLGQWDPFYFVYWVQLTGTTAMVLVDYCALARFLSLMPWNRREPLSRSLVLRTFVSPPVKGNILQGLPAQ
jgi:hypothetical protein